MHKNSIPRILAGALALVAIGSFFLGRQTVQGNNAAANRVYELRVYHAAPGKLQDLHARFRNHTLRLFEKHGMRNVVYLSPQEKPASEDTLVYLVSHVSRETAKISWEEFRKDPEWIKAKMESEKNGSLTTKVESTFFDPTDYSPMK